MPFRIRQGRNCLDNSVVPLEVFFLILTKELLLSSNANGCVKFV